MALHSSSKLARTLELVRNLLARADHEATPKPEADLARAHAERLIEKYRLEEQELIDSGELAITPGFRTIRICLDNSEFRNYYYGIAVAVANHLDVESSTFYVWDASEGQRYIEMEFVGFESDLSITDLLLTECISAFGKYLEPKYDPAESNESNAWRLRAGGWERNRIARVLYGQWSDENEMKQGTRKVTKLIRQHAERNGLDADELLGRGNNIAAYRATFATTFLQTIRSRLWTMAQARSADGAIVFADRKERIREALYVKYPERRPSTAPRVGGTTAFRADCARCQKAASGYCREHSYLRPSRAKSSRGVRWSAAGAARGASAAGSVNLGSTTGRIGSN
jgi:hypothetical protein